MKIKLHQISASTLVAIYTSTIIPSSKTPVPVPGPRPKASAEQGGQPKMNLNFDDDNDALNMNANSIRNQQSNVPADAVALKVLAIITEKKSIAAILKFSTLHDIHARQENVNLKDFVEYYKLLEKCASSVYLSTSSVLANVKSYCLLDLEAGKVGFYFSPIQGEATISLLTDLNESAIRSDALYDECNQKLIAAEKDGKELALKLQKLVDQVEVRETQLFMQFVSLLNEKKKMIRELQQDIEALKNVPTAAVEDELVESDS